MISGTLGFANIFALVLGQILWAMLAIVAMLLLGLGLGYAALNKAGPHLAAHHHRDAPRWIRRRTRYVLRRARIYRLRTVTAVTRSYAMISRAG